MWGFCYTQCRYNISRKDFKELNVVKVSGIDQISARFLKDGAPVIAIHLTSIINLLIKLDTFPSQCKIAKIKPLFKKGIKTEAKNNGPISLLPLILKVIEKSIHDQCKITFEEMNCYTVTNQVLEQIIPQIHNCLN